MSYIQIVVNIYETCIFISLSHYLITDQFSRHIYRCLPPHAEERSIADAKAVTLTEQLLERGGWEASLSTPEFVFSLMPFRHSGTLDRLEVVLRLIEDRKKVDKHSELLSKFQKQTVRRYQALQDRAKVTLYLLQFDIADCVF